MKASVRRRLHEAKGADWLDAGLTRQGVRVILREQHDFAGDYFDHRLAFKANEQSGASAEDPNAFLDDVVRRWRKVASRGG